MTNNPSREAIYRALFGSLAPRKSLLEALESNEPSSVPNNQLRLGALGGLFGAPPPSASFGLLADLGKPPESSFGLLGVLAPDAVAAPAPTKRRAFFSFHYGDVMRVNNVRNSGEFKTSQAKGREVEGFYDGSLWESRKLDGPEAIKNLIRNGVHNTSAVCVLAGTATWSRQWVRYEIARAIIDERGLLTVHINGLRHHKSLLPEPRGPNPLNFMGIGAVAGIGMTGPSYFLFELKNNQWQPYGDYKSAVKLPRWLSPPPAGWVTPLSAGTAEYDYVGQDGHRNIGHWIDTAAIRAGR